MAHNIRSPREDLLISSEGSEVSAEVGELPYSFAALRFGVPMVRSDHRLQGRRRSFCRLSACLAWPHGLFGTCLPCNRGPLGFFEFLYHLSSCGIKTMNAHGVFSLKIQSHTKPAHSDSRGHIPVSRYIQRKFLFTFVRKAKEYNSNASGKQPKASKKGKLHIIWTERHGDPFRKCRLGVA